MSVITTAELAALLAPAPRSGHHHGEDHYRARLTDAQVREMRETFARWQAEDAHAHPLNSHERRGYKRLGKLFNCAPMTARDIVNGWTRKYAGGPVVQR